MTDALPMPAYEPRLTRPLGVREAAGWKVKLIGITAGDELPGGSALDAALDAAVKQLPQPATTERRQGMAFLIVHAGTEALWGILGWWELDILYLRTLRADLGTSTFTVVPPDGPTACAWELLVVDAERQAWVTHVLSNPESPDYAAYLA
ncbi:hypothetical protein ACFPJ1_13260 [Kribbella qitaiheensis]|uniref:hypothetical protein n=1 Tax=Kribbella qitaiheensis TaxID=1544730 RepID=UPI0036142781